MHVCIASFGIHCSYFKYIFAPLGAHPVETVCHQNQKLGPTRSMTESEAILTLEDRITQVSTYPRGLQGYVALL